MTTTNKYKFKTHSEYETGKHSTEQLIDSVSMTVPGQAHTITEILIRFQNGTLPNISKNNPYYETHEDFDSNDPTEAPDFDLTDAENIMHQIKQNQKTQAIKTETQNESEKLSTQKTQKTDNSETKNDKLNDE